MLTLASDAPPDEGDHYQDFLETLSFLYGRKRGPEVAATLAREMRAFRGLLRASTVTVTYLSGGDPPVHPNGACAVALIDRAGRIHGRARL